MVGLAFLTVGRSVEVFDVRQAYVAFVMRAVESSAEESSESIAALAERDGISGPFFAK